MTKSVLPSDAVKAPVWYLRGSQLDSRPDYGLTWMRFLYFLSPVKFQESTFM